MNLFRDIEFDDETDQFTNRWIRMNFHQHGHLVLLLEG
jgi:hypothetical protein